MQLKKLEMTTRSDPEYKDSMMVKKGEKVLPEISSLLIDWINREYEVHAINVYYDKIIPDDRPRIQVIFENHEDISKFRENGGIGKHIQERQFKISTKYTELVKMLGLEDSHSTDNIFVCYSEFSKLYRSGLNAQVPKIRADELFEKYKGDLIWQIKADETDGTILIVFFYNNEEKNKTFNFHLTQNLKDEYFALLKEFDEFGYLKEVSIDKQSKEDFEKINNGSWSDWGKRRYF
jgi:hypothetical protein